MVDHSGYHKHTMQQSHTGVIGDIAINLEHVHAIFERWMNTDDFYIRDISKGRTVFTVDWADLLAVYGAPFAVLLEIIAEEEEVIVPIDASYLRLFPDQNAAQEVRQKCRTVVCTRSMPHNRAHWIMREILQHGQWPQPPRTANWFYGVIFPTQEHINVMIASHSEFVAWAQQSEISRYDEGTDEDVCRNYECVKHELFPHAFGTIEASCFSIDEYFRAQHYDSYHVIQTLHIIRPDNEPVQQSRMIEDAMMYLLPNVLRQKKINVERKMKFVFHQQDWWTWNCLRTFRKPATVPHQKRIHDVLRFHREIRMCKFFLDHAVPFMCYKGILHSDTVPKIMKYCGPLQRVSFLDSELDSTCTHRSGGLHTRKRRSIGLGAPDALVESFKTTMFTNANTYFVLVMGRVCGKLAVVGGSSFVAISDTPQMLGQEGEGAK